jgi:hypothetical protein
MNDISIRKSCSLSAHEFTSDISIRRACSSSTHEFTEIGTTTLGGEGPSSLEESQRLINDDSAIGTKTLSPEKSQWAFPCDLSQQCWPLM